MSSKLYMGNLPADVTEAELRQLFTDLDLSCTDVLVKRGGYGFVDCLDQQAADRFIDKLNGYNYLGTPLVVEPSVSSAASSRRGLMQPLNDHQHYGGGSYQQHHPSPYQPPRDHQHHHHQSSMSSGPAGRMSALGAGRTSVGARPGVLSQQQQHGGYSTAPGLMSPPQSSVSADFPLRILVNSEMVGAIIGRQGNTIRQITQSTRARVDVHRKDNAGSLEKAITIYGNPDNCDNACKKILEVMLQEADSTNKGEVPLKLLAHNNLIGRIIGKGGNVIKRVMEETDTKITVSSVSDVNGFNQERTITIRGEVDGVSEAERRVVAKLRQSYENDLQVLAPQSVMYPGLHPMAMMSTVGLGYGRGGGGGGPPGAMGGGGLYGGGGPTTYPPVYPSPSPPGGHAAGASSAAETTYLYVPSASVGALIGRKGSYIRNIIRFSGASVKIGQQEETAGGGVERRSSDTNADPDSPSEEQPEQPRSEEEPLGEAEPTARNNEDASTPPPPALMNHRAGDPYSKPPLKSTPPPPAVAERRVTILGSAESQWKAQFLIFDKLREEGYGAGIEDVRLPIEILVPSGQVGRIIGKKGQNVRELQRTSGTLIKLPQPPVAGATPPQFTPVHMVGTFYAVQSAQRRVRSLVAQGAPQTVQTTGARQAAPAADQPQEEGGQEQETQEDKEQEEGADKEEDPSPEVAAAGDTV